MRKRFYVMVLSALLAFGLCACDKNSETNSAMSKQEIFTINGESIEDYIAQHSEEFYTEKGENGYYDTSSNHKSELKRDIQSNGDIISVSYQYFGDFAIETKEREYVNSYYEIETITTHTLYFKQWKLNNIDKIGDFQYAPPYLFSTYDNKLTVFELAEDKNSADIVYEEDCKSN